MKYLLSCLLTVCLSVLGFQAEAQISESTNVQVASVSGSSVEVAGSSVDVAATPKKRIKKRKKKRAVKRAAKNPKFKKRKARRIAKRKCKKKNG